MFNRWCYDCAPPEQEPVQQGQVQHQMQQQQEEQQEEQQQDDEQEIQRPHSLPQQAEEVNEILRNIRANMNLETVKTKTRATKTYYKHQLENTRFIMWLYHNNNYRDSLLETDLVCDLDHVKEAIIFDQKFLHRIRNLPQDEQAKRKVQYIYTHQTTFVKLECLNKGGLAPKRPTVIHQNITPDIYGDYLCSKRKGSGALLKPGVYQGMRSGLTYLFTRYKKKLDTVKFDEITEILQGVKRVANEAKQAGEGNIEDGKREISFPLYEAINQWCVEDGTREAIFFRFYDENCWNLACRGDSTGRIQLSHLLWKADTLAIPFAHSKDEQTGSDRRKRVARNVYGNPFDYRSDYYSALFEYLCMFPEVLTDPSGRLFPGSEDYVTSRFSKQLSALLERHGEELAAFGYKIVDIGIRSFRKGAHTYMNNGSTSGPSGTATCIRGGHSIGGVRGLYVLHARAGDTYCGRVLSGLPQHKAEFAVSFADFTVVREGITEEELQNEQKDLDEKVKNAVYSLFGKDAVESNPNLYPILRVGLAAHLLHRDELLRAYARDSPIRSTTLFTSAAILELKRYVKIAMPWEDNGLAYATGIPPHTMILAGNEEIKAMLKDLLPAIEKFMDDRTMCGTLSENRMREIIQNEQLETRQQLDAIKNLLSQEGRAPPGDQEVIENGKFRLWNVDGVRRRIPPDWVFPLGPIMNVYVYWHHGDEVRKISPMKLFQHKDLAIFTSDKRRYKKNFEEVSQLFKMLDKEAERMGLLKDFPTRDNTIKAYYQCKGVLGISDKTPLGRKRTWVKIAWGTVIRERKRMKKQRTDAENREQVREEEEEQDTQQQQHDGTRMQMEEV